MADIDTSTLPRSWAEAKASGSKHYFTGKPCCRGHVAPRFTSAQVCTECGREQKLEKAHGSLERAAAKAEERRLRVEERKQTPCSVDGCGNLAFRGGMCNAHRLRLARRGRLHRVNRDLSGLTPDERSEVEREWKRKDYLKNSDAYKARARKWQADNPEAYRKRCADYFGREDIKAEMRRKTREWAEANPERKRQQDKEFAEKNPGLVRSYKAKRRALLKRATPSWLTEEQWEQIRAVYKEAVRLEQETGIRHDVDHIVPLAGKIVTGLHVPWNLRAIPRTQNNRRPRIYQGDD